MLITLPREVGNYFTGGVLETTWGANYSTEGMLEPPQDAYYTNRGMPEFQKILRMLITPQRDTVNNLGANYSTEGYCKQLRS